MKRYITSIGTGNKTIETLISKDGHAKIDGRDYEYEARFVNPNVMVLRMNGNNYYLTCTEDEDNVTEVNIESDVFKTVTKSELDLLVEKLSGGKGEAKVKKEVYSPMPGIIKKLNVSEGQQVSKGEVLLVLEAMKMENEIKAAKDCVIKKINVDPMSSVEKNELLIMLE